MGLHWDKERGVNIMTDGDKKVFKLYLVGAFGTDVAKACIFPPVHYFLPDLLLHKREQAEENFHFSSPQNTGWQYWPHFQVIQPNASAKGRNPFQPSLNSNDITQPNPPTVTDMPIDEANLSTTPVTPLLISVVAVSGSIKGGMTIEKR